MADDAQAAAQATLLAAVGTGVQVVRIGHSGAKAAWAGTGGGSSGADH